MNLAMFINSVENLIRCENWDTTPVKRIPIANQRLAPYLSHQLSGFSQLGTPAAIDNPSGCSSSARRCRMKAARCRRPDLSWACGMPLLNWLATELDSVLLMVEHRANHMALRVRFPRKTWQCLHCHLLGRKPPAPAHRSDGAGPTKPCGAQHVPSAGGLRTACAARNCVQSSTAREVTALHTRRREAPTEPRDRCTSALAHRSARRLPLAGLD